jgi:D-3-phosphoglycerate dehydrogenase
LPTIVGADRFYMDGEAIGTINTLGQMIWADCKTEDELIAKLKQTNAKVIISEYFKITGRVMDASPGLKGIVVWGVGYDHVDVNAASEKGIYVANTRGSNAESVAEHVFALILNLSRKLLQLDTFVKRGDWTTREETGLPRELTSHDLCQKTIGIVGFGFIGSLVARIAKGFNMRVLTFDPYLTAEVVKEKGGELVDLHNLLRESDFITLHVVLTDETRNLIGARELDLMKPNAYLINASRGAVVDESALIKAIEERKIAGAGLDVFSKEPIDPSNALLKLDNVIVSPHCAGNSEEALTATAMMVGEEAIQILQDEVPKNLVNRPQLLKKGFVK